MTGARRHAARAAALAAALAAAAPARAGPPTDAVLHLAATTLAWRGGALADGRPAPALTLALRLPPAGAEAGADAGALERLGVGRWIARWDPWDGSGYRLQPSAGLSLIGAWERPSATEPLALEPDDAPDSPRSRILGDAARTTLAVLDLSELPRVLVALGAGGGRSHLHAYLGWQVTVGAATAPR